MDGTGGDGGSGARGGVDAADGTDDREWNDPPGVTDDGDGGDAPASRRAFRLTTGLLFMLLSAVWFREPLAAVLPRLWPPGGARWATLVLVVGLSLVLPLMIGAALGELLHERL